MGADFVVYILVMSFFVTNLFIGVLIDFIGTSDGTSLLTEKQQKLVDIKKFRESLEQQNSSWFVVPPRRSRCTVCCGSNT
eukprot:SAG11_NODE_4416_length_1905_cov_1.266888_1_plen_80_part_00